MSQDELARLRTENAELHQRVERLAASVEVGHLDAALQTLLDNIPFALFVVGPDDRFVGYRMGQMRLKIPPHSYVGRSVREIFPPAYAELFERTMRAARESGVQQTIEYDSPESPPRHISPTPDGSLAVLVRDDSVQRRALASVEESARRFRALIEESTDILYLCDADLRIRYWSPGAARALGWSNDEALGQYGIDFVHPDDQATLTRREPSTPAPEHATFHYRVKHRDGTWRSLEAVVQNHLDDPRIGAIIVNARDVTEQRRLETRVADAQKLESIGRLAGGIAHDFNNLLTVIMTCADLAQQAVLDERVPERSDLEEVLAASERARDLTQQLLAFARRQVIAPVVLDVRALLTDSERLLRRLLGEDVLLATHRANEPCLVKADPTQLQQVLLNLAVNARDAMPRGGRLEIGVDVVELDATRVEALGVTVGAPSVASTDATSEPHASLAGGPGRYVRLRVRDEGTGLSPEARAHLFEPFFTTKGKGQGTGLGLATVYGIVHQSSGGIAVESAEGRGTTFEIFLPASEDETTEAREAAPDGDLGGDETILLVEDEASVATVAQRILEGAGYRVFRARHGLEALAIAEREARLDLLVTDVVLPGLDGHEIADRVLALHPHTKVLFVSGYAEDVIARRGRLEPGTELLMKPFTPLSLRRHVRDVLGPRSADP